LNRAILDEGNKKGITKGPVFAVLGKCKIDMDRAFTGTYSSSPGGESQFEYV